MNSSRDDEVRRFVGVNPPPTDHPLTPPLPAGNRKQRRKDAAESRRAKRAFRKALKTVGPSCLGRGS